jgi:endonuclease-3
MSTEVTPLTNAAITVPPKLERVYDLLVQAYGQPDWCPDGDALGGLVGTILSQHTSDVNSGRAYAQLVAAFPTWEAVRDAPAEQVAQAIRVGGLANLKAQRIQAVLRVLTSRLHGARARATNGSETTGQQPAQASASEGAPLSLDFLADLPLAEARAYLHSLPGVGPKTAACVLLFSLGLPAFPVDTHVERTSKRLGLIGAKVTADQAHVVFERIVPAEWAYPLHVNLIRHGRRVCHAQRPACERCSLRLECAYYAGLSAEI